MGLFQITRICFGISGSILFLKAYCHEVAKAQSNTRNKISLCVFVPS